jgi:hypothetical protein
MPTSHQPSSVAARVRYLVRPSYRPLWAALHRLTPSSAGLLAERPPEPGTPVLLELPGPGLPRGRLAHVESAEPAPAGGYLLRCRFARPLSHNGLAVIRRGLASPE